MAEAVDGSGGQQCGLESISWGGSVVWRGGAEGEAASLGPVLAGLGASERHADYIEKLLHPLLISMVCEAMSCMPADPAFFCLEWLLRHLEAPVSVSQAVARWAARRRGLTASVDDGASERYSVDAEESPDEHHLGPPQSILKKPGGLSSRSSRKGSRQTSFKAETEILRHEIATMIQQKQEGADFEATMQDEASLESGAQEAEASLERSGPRRRTSTVRIVMPPPEEVERMLAAVPGLEALDDEDRSSVAKVCTVRQYDAQAEIMKYGDISSEIFVVMSGNCRVLVPEFKRTLHPGDVFNEAALRKGEVAAEAMLAAAPNTDVQLLSVSVKDMEGLGLWKKCLKKQKRVSDSHYIARPDMQRQPERTRLPTHPDVISEEDEEAPYVPDDADTQKSDQDLELIKLAVSRNQLTELLQLSEEQIHELACCMYIREFPANSTIIQKGDRGEHFYVVREGIAEVISNPDPGNPARNVPGTMAIQFYSGSSFGELALLYNCQRKATVVSTRQSSLWVLDLTGWRNVLSKMPTSRIEVYLGMLTTVPELTEHVPQAEKRRALADCLEEVYYRSGETVVVEGTIGLTLYIVLDGSCGTIVEGQRARSLKKGDYFGEGSLFRGLPYPETVFVTSEHATVLQLDRETCQHLQLNISFQDSASGNDAGQKVVGPRRHSLMHMAIKDASSVSLHRLDSNRLEIPQGRLENVGYLGAGAFAVVSLVHDPVEDKLYALKAMSKQAIVEQSLKGMVLGERNALAELGDSPFVVKLITTYKDDNCIYLLMEPALGGELFGLYSESDWYGDEDKASFFTSCVALGIDHIHSKKIIHRDIKLENVLLDDKGYARVTDLGIAKVVIGKTYTVCGTSDYLAPETLKQAGHNRAVDWWALGILSYAMVAGRMPFDAGDVLQIYKNIMKGFRKEHFPSAFNADLVDFVKSLCRKKPQERITMLPGGLQNLAKHPWIAKGDPSRWDQIATRTLTAPWEPTPLTIEERRATMKQNHDAEAFEPYVDDGTDWDEPF